MIVCKVCKSKKIKLFVKIKNLIYWRCLLCKAVILDKQHYISESKEKKHYLKHNNNMKDQNYRKFLSKILIPLKSKISVNDFGLDYGCGYSPTLVDILRKDGFTVDFYDPFFFPNKQIFLKKYKFITCSEVVEHFIDPYKEFKKINNL